MATAPDEVKKTATVPAPTGAPDAWRSFRTEMDRLFDRFAGGWGIPSLRRMFEGGPAMCYEGLFTLPSPAVEITDDAAYKVTAELPGMSEKEIEVVVSGDMLTLKGEKRQEKEQKGQNFHLSERSYMGRSSAASTCPKGSSPTRSRPTSPRRADRHDAEVGEDGGAEEEDRVKSAV